MDGWIYFSKQADVYRIRTDGTKLSRLYTARTAASSDYSVTIWDILAVDDKLYVLYSDSTVKPGNKVISMNLDGSSPQVIYESLSSLGAAMTIYDGQIFLLTQNTLSVMRYDIRENNVNTFVLKNARMKAGNYYLQVSSAGRLYFYSAPADYGDTSSAAYSFNPDGSDVRQETVYSRYIIVDNTIFYYECSDGNIYSTLLNGDSTPVKVTDSKIRGFFTYHNGYHYTYNFVQSRGKEGQEVKIYKVTSFTTAPQSSGTYGSADEKRLCQQFRRS
ncbi:hypothetical protein [Desulfotomaculum sp. 1211_IL3151]|uniref:hypothetical protein n=1 Tax=Desulfotomaculum sp. 1211_IL3151 TaxID=3084055 RepID=UPI002FDB8641